MYIICLLQKEKEVLGLLSRLDLQNVHFTESPPGIFTPKINFLCLVSVAIIDLWMCNHCVCKCYCTSGDANQSVHLVASEGLEAYLPLADMVDISAEVQRLSKRLSKMQSEYEGLVARLSSPKVWT